MKQSTMPRKRKNIPHIITEEQLKKIFHAIAQPDQKYKDREKRKFTRLRNCMIFFLMFYLGLRPKEAYASKVEHIDLEKSELFIPGENNKQRNSDIIPLPDFVCDKLEQYLAVRNKTFKKSGWLFPSNHFRSKGKLAHNVVARIFKEACKKVGLNRVGYIDSLGRKRTVLNPYSLRHSFGNRAYEKTKDIQKTAFLLRQYDSQCRNALVYIHTTQNKSRREIMNELYRN